MLLYYGLIIVSSGELGNLDNRSKRSRAEAHINTDHSYMADQGLDFLTSLTTFTMAPVWKKGKTKREKKVFGPPESTVYYMLLSVDNNNFASAREKKMNIR